MEAINISNLFSHSFKMLFEYLLSGSGYKLTSSWLSIISESADMVKWIPAAFVVRRTTSFSDPYKHVSIVSVNLKNLFSNNYTLSGSHSI